MLTYPLISDATLTRPKKPKKPVEKKIKSETKFCDKKKGKKCKCSK